MARLGCHCGADMTNTDGPSPHRLNVTGWDELAECRNSFQNRSEPVEYWYCTECKRIYEVQAVSCGRILRNFKYVSEPTEKCNLDGFEELFILWDDIIYLPIKKQYMG